MLVYIKEIQKKETVGVGGALGSGGDEGAGSNTHGTRRSCPVRPLPLYSAIPLAELNLSGRSQKTSLLGLVDELMNKGVIFVFFFYIILIFIFWDGRGNCCWSNQR